MFDTNQITDDRSYKLVTREYNILMYGHSCPYCIISKGEQFLYE